MPGNTHQTRRMEGRTWRMEGPGIHSRRSPGVCDATNKLSTHTTKGVTLAWRDDTIIRASACAIIHPGHVTRVELDIGKDKPVAVYGVYLSDIGRPEPEITAAWTALTARVAGETRTRIWITVPR